MPISPVTGGRAWPNSRPGEGLVSAWGRDGRITAPGAGIRVDLGESWLEVLLRGAGSGGQFGAFVFHHAVIAENPPHAHQGFAKLLYILDGQYEFRVGDATFSGGPGSLVLVPQGSQHAFTTATGGRVLFVCTPSGNEEMFRARQVSARSGTVGLPGPGRPQAAARVTRRSGPSGVDGVLAVGEHGRLWAA